MYAQYRASNFGWGNSWRIWCFDSHFVIIRPAILYHCVHVQCTIAYEHHQIKTSQFTKISVTNFPLQNFQLHLWYMYMYMYKYMYI